MGSNGSSQGQRVTMLIDDELYRAVKSTAINSGMKTYEYINMVLAKAVGKKVPKIKHPSKQDLDQPKETPKSEPIKEGAA